MMICKLGLVLVLGTSLLAGCATNGNDPLAGEAGDGSGAGGKADGAADTFGFLTAVQVGRFECNGKGSCTHVTLARANRSTTTCADGSTQASCDVRYLDFSNLSLSSDQLDALDRALGQSADDGAARLLVRGAYVHGTNPNDPGQDWVTFQVSEVWQAQIDGGALDGVYALVKDNGLRCITAPCPTLTEAKLNSVKTANIDGLHWPGQSESDPPTALQQTVAGVIDDASSPGAIVVGDAYDTKIMGLSAKERTVDQVFLKVEAAAQPTANACEAAGGTCVPLVPDACEFGTVGDASTYSCGGGVGVECCLPPQ